MIDQTPIEQEQKPDEPQDNTPPDPGTNNVGTGAPDGFGLGKYTGKGGTHMGGNGNKAASRWGWYAGQVQSKIAEGLRNNRKTRSAAIRGLEARVWPDNVGRINRAQLSGTTGDPAVDAAIKNEILTGMQLQQPPPAGMPLPIVLRLNARRP